jgi:cation-transporting ATPase I
VHVCGDCRVHFRKFCRIKKEKEEGTGSLMSVAVAEEPAILHALPGRVRVHLPAWSGKGKRSIEKQLRQVWGVQSVQANPLTGNILVQFDPTITDERTIVDLIHTMEVDEAERETEKEAPRPHVLFDQRKGTVRARITVRGLNRDPHVAQRLAAHLATRSSVRFSISQLTGRVLIEFEEHEGDLDELISEIADLELPDLPGEDHPAHPLDPGPLFQSASRTIAATLGLALHAGRQLLGVEEALPGQAVALQTASIIGILQGIPPIRYGLRKLLGRTVADLVVHVPNIISLTLGGSVLGLAVVGLESLRMVTEVQARQQAWRRHEQREKHMPSSQPGAIIRLETGERTPHAAEVLEGAGIAIGRDGLPLSAVEGVSLPPGARLFGGPFVLKLQHSDSFAPFIPTPRPVPIAPSLQDRYLRILSPLSLVYAAGTALLTRSFTQALIALLLVNPRVSLIGQETADLSANARVLRAGVTVVGTRKERRVRLPGAVLIDGARVLTEGLELTSSVPLTEERDPTEILTLASGIAEMAGSPWGNAFRSAGNVQASDGAFDGVTATATIEGIRYTLGPFTGEHEEDLVEAERLRQRGNYVLVLRSEQEARPLGLLVLRPRLAQGVSTLVECCRRYGIPLELLASQDHPAIQALARRAGISLLFEEDGVAAVRAKQQTGAIVAFISDHAGAAACFEACDLAIGLSDGRSRLPVRADLLAPDLEAVAAILEAGAQREAATRDATAFSLLSNVAGGIIGLQGMPGIEVASRGVYIAALGAIADAWYRLRGGQRPGSLRARFVDPRPERWGRRSVATVLRTLQTTENGLTSAQALERRQKASPVVHRHYLLTALLDQLRSPLIGILAAGAGLSLFLGAVADVAVIGATIGATVAIGAWQEYKADRVAEALARMGSSHASVLRDGAVTVVPANEVVPGDVLLLAPGDRVAADARVLLSQGLEVDEAALTGESLPVPKVASGGTDASHIVLEGSDITSGNGRAIVVAVGRQTRMGATAAALSIEETRQSPLGIRLGRMIIRLLPLSVAGGALVVGSGLLWGYPLAALLATGATIALASAPEGLPILTRVGEAGVARRLADRSALVRRLTAVEALGRVDIVCTDKTGTLTEGRLALSLVADGEEEAPLPGELSERLRSVLLTAAFASPHPDAPDAHAHPTDIAVIQGAQEAGLGEQMYLSRARELSFDPARSFHASVVEDRLCIKGAPETIIARCSWTYRQGRKRPLSQAGKQRLLARSRSLAERGLRVLMVAEGSPEMQLDNPRELTALGFIGISDPLRADVRASVERCRAAGVRVVMITGDHPATARMIAQEAGLLDKGGEVITGSEIADLQNGELDERLENVAVIARATPLDKLRIVESLQRHGHTVAMTGDGVNDAPALRLADIGVAMGHTGTEVARQTADVVLVNDDFSTLVESFVEGRSFWRNIRRALGLLLGGNLGELGLVVGASVLGFSSPLTIRQILAVNIITDILPALAVTMQQPEHRNLAGLAREGEGAFGRPLRNDVMRRALASSLPSLANFFLLTATGAAAEASTVAFASIIATQLAQTLDAGWSEGNLTSSVLGAVTGSAGVLAIALIAPPLRTFLNLVLPSPTGWLLIGGGALASVVLSRTLALPERSQERRLALPAPAQPVALLPPIQIMKSP